MTSIAIIVPSYERPAQLRRCLTALSQLEGGPWPVIVVDDGGNVPAAPVCAEFGDWVRCIRQANAGPGAARNTGAEAATEAELLCFTDDDCVPRPDWVHRLAAAQGGRSGLLVGGRIDNLLHDNVYSSASQALSSYLYEYYQRTGSAMEFFTTNNMCCRRVDFLAAGGFDATLATASEDRDFSLRWKDRVGTLTYARDAVVGHAHDLTLGRFWKQHANYGRGARHLHLSMDRRGDSRPKLEAVGFYLGMLAYPLHRPGRLRLVQSMLVGLSQVAMISGYLTEIRKERAKATISTGGTA